MEYGLEGEMWTVGGGLGLIGFGRAACYMDGSLGNGLLLGFDLTSSHV